MKNGLYGVELSRRESLISIRQNVKDITIPSEERSIDMHPMDFEEFCLALGEAQMVNEGDFSTRITTKKSTATISRLIS